MYSKLYAWTCGLLLGAFVMGQVDACGCSSAPAAPQEQQEDADEAPAKPNKLSITPTGKRG